MAEEFDACLGALDDCEAVASALTLERLRRDGCGPEPWLRRLLAELDGAAAGYRMW